MVVVAVGLMPQLYDLTNRPMTWEQAHQRVANYWATYGRDGELLAQPTLYSSPCRRSLHSRCIGSRREGGSGRVIEDCGCQCHAGGHK